MSLLPVEDALERLLRAARPPERTESVPLHEACDRVLASDVVARLGGDEFGGILAHVDRDLGLRKAESLARALATRSAQWRGKVLPIQFSYGVHQLQAGESSDSAMAQADRAMYAQKRAHGE